MLKHLALFFLRLYSGVLFAAFYVRFVLFFLGFPRNLFAVLALR